MRGIYRIPAVLIFAAQPLMAEMVFAQASPTVITGIQVDSTGDGIQIGIQTESGSAPRFLPPSPNYRNVLVLDLLDAQLASGSLSESNPVPGILSVNVDRRTDDSVRLTIIGSEQLPPVNVQDGESGVVVSLGGSQLPVASVPTPWVSQPDQTPAPEVPDLELEEITVTAQRRSYAATESSTAIGIEVPLQDLPVSVQVIPEDIIRDQNANSIGDVLQNVSGYINPGTYAGGLYDQLSLRGFFLFSNNIRRNGTPVSRTGELLNPNVERVEVVKGPGSILFGDVQPGGVINIITKDPLTEPFAELNLGFGSFNTYNFSLDLSGPLNEDRTLAYRLNLAYEEPTAFEISCFNEVILSRL